MLLKSIGMAIAGLILGLGALAFIPQETDAPVAQLATSEASADSNSMEPTSTDELTVAERINKIRSAIAVKIENNRVPLMQSTLEQAKDVLDKVSRGLEQGKITNEQAREIAMITCDGIKKQAKAVEGLDQSLQRFTNKMNPKENSSESAAKFAKGFKEGLKAGLKKSLNGQ